MHSSAAMLNQRDLFVARRNPLAARWTTRCGSMPRAAATEVPGDGVSDREKDAGNWGSTANDGSVPAPDETTPEDARTEPVRPTPRPSTPGPDVNTDNENLADDTPLVGDRDGSRVKRSPRDGTPADVA